MKLRALALALVVAASTFACTGGQQLEWLAAHLAGHGAEADAAARQFEAERAEDTAGLPCAEWYDTARWVGWDRDQWHTVARTMRGESMCNPNAHNPSGATGLMQVMPMWADDCGGVPSDLYDPEFNLKCALHVLDVSSWAAWSAHRAGY